jgi:tetratricopeptide (TPR) repeat protein
MEHSATIAAIAAAILLASAGPLSAQSDRSLLRDGNRLYEASKFADAEVNYRKSLEMNKETLHGPFNLGDALYRQDRFDEAAEQYRAAAARTTDPKVKAEAMHNLGNSLLRSQKYPESVASFKEALKLNPKDGETKYNLEYAKQMLKQQQEQQQQKQDQKKDEKKDEKKDQKQDQQQKQEDQKQDQQQKQQQKEKQQAQKKQEISKADAERILEALRNEEKNVKKKLQKKAPAHVQVEKDW